jgi:hypothetical protein
MIKVCLICEEGNLIEHVGLHEVICCGEDYLINYHYSKCNICNSETADAEQVALNKKIFMDFKDNQFWENVQIED